MKKIAILVFAAFACHAYAGEINFQKGSWSDLKARAKAENKYLFVDCMTDWCYWCKVMDKQTFSNSAVADTMNKAFLATRIDMEKDYGITLAMKYRVSGFPTFLVFSPEGKLVYRFAGYREVPVFLADLSNAVSPLRQQTYAGITDNMSPGYPDFYKKMFAGNGKRIFPDSATIAAFFNGHSDWMDEVAFGVLMRCSAPPQVNQFFLDQIDGYRKLYGPEPDEKAYDLISDKVHKAAEIKNREGLNEALIMADRYLPGDTLDFKQTLTFKYFSQAAEWQNFSAEFQAYLDKKGTLGAETINSYAWDIYEHCDDPDVVASACGWMKKATESEPQYAYLDTYAALLFKSGNYPEAERVARQAIGSGKKEGVDVKETEKLLVKIQSAVKP